MTEGRRSSGTPTVRWSTQRRRPQLQSVLACIVGLKEAQRVVTDALEALIRGSERPSANSAASVGSISVGSAAGTGEAELRRRLLQPNPVDEHIPLEACDWINITACNTTGILASSSGSDGKSLRRQNQSNHAAVLCVSVCVCSAPVFLWKRNLGSRVQSFGLEPRGAHQGAAGHRPDLFVSRL